MIEPAAARPMEFEDVVRPHLEYLYGLALRLCGNRTRAEDITQDALLRAFRGSPRPRNRERPRLWLTRILTTPSPTRTACTSTSSSCSTT